MESKPKHSSADRDVIARMLGSAAVKPLPPMAPVAVAPKRATARRSASGASGGSGGEPDFVRMTPDEKVAWNLARWKRVLG